MERMLTIADNVKRIVKEVPIRSYNQLIYAYWVLVDGITSIKEARKATPAESITRVHRLLVEAGEIDPPAWSRKRERKVTPIDEFASVK